MFGADSDQLRQIGAQLFDAGDLVESIGFDLRSDIEHVDWQGRDADTYRADWGDRLHVDLRDLGERLRDLRRELDTQSDRQDEASAPGSNEGCFESTIGGIGQFFGGLLVDGLWGDLTGIFDLFKAETWAQMGTLIGYNPEDGSWGNWGLAGDSWVALGKDMIAYDMWGENWPRALGQVVWNFGTLPLAAFKIAKGGKLARLGRGDRGDGPDTDLPANRDRNGWNTTDGQSPDVRTDRRTPEQGADPAKMGFHNGPYDTGARIDADTGELISTSGDRFPPDRVHEHHTTTTGDYDTALNPRTDSTPNAPRNPDGTVQPFDPDSRYVLDQGRMVVETNELGVPTYTRYHYEGSAPDGFDTRTGDADRANNVPGQTTPAAEWPGDIGRPGDHRGHAGPAQAGMPNEGINTPPQTPTANLSGQRIVDNAIGRAYENAPADQRPFVVERSVQTDANGRAESYTWTVTDAKGDPVPLQRPNGDPVPMTVYN